MHHPNLVRGLLLAVALIAALGGAAFLVHFVAAVHAAHGG